MQIECTTDPQYMPSMKIVIVICRGLVKIYSNSKHWDVIFHSGGEFPSELHERVRVV